MALLSFVVFAVFFLPTVVLGRESLIGRIRDMAGQNPDPQAQQMILWFTTHNGFIVLTGVVMMISLLVFTIVGLVSGALMTAQSRNRL